MSDDQRLVDRRGIGALGIAGGGQRGAGPVLEGLDRVGAAFRRDDDRGADFEPRGAAGRRGDIGVGDARAGEEGLDDVARAPVELVAADRIELDRAGRGSATTRTGAAAWAA